MSANLIPILAILVPVILTILGAAFVIVYRIGGQISRFQSDLSGVREDVDHLERTMATKEELRIVQDTSSNMIKSIVESIGNRIEGIEAHIRSCTTLSEGMKERA